MNYYETLEVDKDATQAEIKKAFRKKAAQHHPDREGGAHGAFQDAQKAYECLSDPAKRKVYDITGQDIGDSAIESNALDLVTGLLSTALENSIHRVVEAAVGSISHSQYDAATKLRLLNVKIILLTKQRGRFLKKRPGDNLVHRVIDKALDSTRGEIALLERMQLVHNAALVILSDYSEEVEAPPARPVYIGNRP